MERGFYFILLALVCGQAAAQSNGDIRLVGGGNSHSGRLEIFLNNVWGTVCYDTVSPGAAQAACRQLGYSDYESVDTVTKMRIQPGSGSILLNSVYCSYNSEDQHILRCSYSQGINSCQHSQDMAIVCSTSRIPPYDTAVKLVNSETGYPSSGTVEVYLNKQWGTICDDDDEVDINEARTICRQLGYTSAISYSSIQSPNSTRVWLESVSCVISQPCLDLCFPYPASSSTPPVCSHVATVTCTFDMEESDNYTPGSKSLCTSYLAIEKHLIAIIIGALVAFLLVCLFFVLIPIICCCCCIPGCILHSCRERRVVYQVIQ